MGGGLLGGEGLRLLLLLRNGKGLHFERAKAIQAGREDARLAGSEEQMTLAVEAQHANVVQLEGPFGLQMLAQLGHFGLYAPECFGVADVVSLYV